MTDTLLATSTSVWEIDPSHSNVEFTIKHMMVSKVKGSFSGVSGTIVIDEENFVNSRADVEIDVATITTRDEKRDAHLRSADFFNVEKFPTMRFVSTSVKARDGDNFVLVGDLTIAGSTRRVELDVERTGTGITPWGQTVAGFEARTKISRKDFDLTWNVALEAGGFLVGDDVNINLNIEAVRQ